MIVLILINFNIHLVVFIIHLLFMKRFECLIIKCFGKVILIEDLFGIRLVE